MLRCTRTINFALRALGCALPCAFAFVASCAVTGNGSPTTSPEGDLADARAATPSELGVPDASGQDIVVFVRAGKQDSERERVVVTRLRTFGRGDTNERVQLFAIVHMARPTYWTEIQRR